MEFERPERIHGGETVGVLGSEFPRTVRALQNTTQHPSLNPDCQIQDLAGNPVRCDPLIDELTRSRGETDEINMVLTWWTGCLLQHAYLTFQVIWGAEGE